MIKNNKIITTIFLSACLGIWAVSAKTSKLAPENIKMPLKNKFDFYILATQWIPGWCVVGSGSSGAIIDTINACQKQNNRPIMFHGLWPENKESDYPANCHKVDELKSQKLSFKNPYIGYLANPDYFINHEWEKHGTCSNYFTPGMEKASPKEYYRQLNAYFGNSLKLYENIKLTVFPIEVSVTELKQQIHSLNLQIPTTAIMVTCDSDLRGQQYLTGLWFCLDKPLDHFTACPSKITRNVCSGRVLTR